MHQLISDSRDKDGVKKENTANYEANQEQSLQRNRLPAGIIFLARSVVVGVAHLLTIELHLLLVDRIVVELVVEWTARVRVLGPATLVRGTVVPVNVRRIRIVERRVDS